MSTSNDIFLEPAIELIEDASLALKWSNSALSVRFLSQFVSVFMFAITNGYDEKTGEKIMNVAPETAKYYGILFLLNLLGLPVDIAYFGFLNIAKEGNTQAIAQNKTT